MEPQTRWDGKSHSRGCGFCAPEILQIKKLYVFVKKMLTNIYVYDNIKSR